MVQIGIFGNKGSGKGIIAQNVLEKYPPETHILYSNSKIINRESRIITPDMICDVVEKKIPFPQNSVIYISEITQWLDARGSGSNMLNKVLSYFLLMSRKMGLPDDYDDGLPIIYDTQYPNLIDVRLWESTDFKKFCRKHILPINFLDTNKPIVLIEVENYQLDLGKDKVIEPELVLANLYYNNYDSREILIIPSSRYDKKR